MKGICLGSWRIWKIWQEMIEETFYMERRGEVKERKERKKGRERKWREGKRKEIMRYVKGIENASILWKHGIMEELRVGGISKKVETHHSGLNLQVIGRHGRCLSRGIMSCWSRFLRQLLTDRRNWRENTGSGETSFEAEDGNKGWFWFEPRLFAQYVE